MTDTLSRENISLTIVKGAGVNILGAIGKLATPAFFIAITRLYGPDAMGAFYIVYAMMNIVASLTVSGLNDGVLILASKLQEEDREKREAALYRVFANGFVIALGISTALVLFVHAGGGQLVLSTYPQAGILDAVRYAVFALPFYVIPVICISATQALIIMRWEACIQGVLLPVSLLVFAVGFYCVTPTLDGLLHAYMAAGIVATAVSLAVFGKYFSFRNLFSEIRRFRFSKPLIRFAVPQNLNMAFSTFIGDLDVVMLGYFAFDPGVVGFYAMGAQITRNIRQIKLAFSGIYSPIITRLFYRRDTKGMTHSFSMISRWVSTAALPAAFLVALYRDELLRLFHSSFTADTHFMLLLLIPPLLSCSFGLAGNILVMTGHSMWNLVNSLAVAGITTWLSMRLIPEFGLMGAAGAAAIGSVVLSAVQLVEAYFISGARILVGKIYKPFLAILPAAAVLAWQASIAEPLYGTTKWVLAGTGVGLFIAILWGLKLEAEDKRTFLPWNHRKSPG